MPFERPTLSQLVDRVRGDLRGRLEVDGPLLRRAMIDVLAIVWAGVVHLLYGFLDWLAKQLFAKTADREALLIKAAEKGFAPIAATYASGEVLATGADGTDIDEGTIIKLDDGVTYRVTALGTIAAGEVTLAVTAVLAGDAANVPEDTELTFESSIPGVDPTVTVLAPGITGGNDEEDLEDFRDRFLAFEREEPRGGSDADYIEWAREVAGVTRAWVYRHELGLGTVVVRFVRDRDASIFPDAGEVAAVQTKLEAERPTTDEPTAMAPVDAPIPFTLSVTPNTLAVKAAVEAEVADLIKREGEPGDGAGRGKILLSAIRTAIGTAAGVTDYNLTTPAADVVPATGELPTKGAFTWM